jgi:hypothetical protein
MTGEIKNDQRLMTRNDQIQVEKGAVRFRSFDRRAFFSSLGGLVIDRCEAVRINSAMQLRRFSIALAVLIMCGGFLSGQTQSVSETGIEGVITISPTRAGPVRADAPSSAPLANATWVVEKDDGVVAKEFTTDEQGRFRVAVEPGHYKVSLKGKRSGVGKYGPFDVNVVAGQMTKIQWQCDSGIR